MDLTRATLNGLWLLTWDPSQAVATRPLAIQINGTWYTYGWDLTKNICELYTSSRAIGSSYTYTPYGTVGIASNAAKVTQSIQWSSEVYDAELGLVYYNFRYYNPTDGRWTRRDPMGDNEHLMSYVTNSPIDYIDYLGLQIDWHHLVPQAIERYLAKDINIHSSEYGYHIDSKYHTGKGGVHPEGWNQEWEAWAKKQTYPIPKSCVDKQLQKMLNNPKYSMLKTYGKKRLLPM